MANQHGVVERPRPSRQENAQNEYAYHLQQAEQPKRAPSDLDPRTFDHHVGERANRNAPPELVDEPALGAARNAFGALHSRLTQLAEGEAAIKADSTLTPDARLLEIDNLHRTPKGNAPTHKVADARSRVREARNTADGQIANALKSVMDPTEARELRDRVAAMSSEQREELLRDIRQNGDAKLAAALTAHPSPWASGLDRGSYGELRRYAENALAADAVKRRDQLTAAEKQLDQAEERYLSTLNAWAPDQGKVSEIRTRQEASKRARAAE
jgi:hypothetical protein